MLNGIFFILFSLAAITILLWLLQRVFNSNNSLKHAPTELSGFPREVRGKIWLETICETLMEWRVMIVGAFLFICAGVLSVVVESIIPLLNARHIFLLLSFIIGLSAKPYIWNRARARLLTRLEVKELSKNNLDI